MSTVVADSRDREAWLLARRSMVCASDVPVILGHWGSVARLWAEKRGEAEPVADTEQLLLGRLMEPSILAAYTTRTGNPAHADGRLYTQTRGGLTLGATLDAWTEVDGLEVPLEVKNVGAYNASEWEDGPPEKYIAQVQAQMLVTSTPFAIVCALIGGQRLSIHRVDRDALLQVRILTAAQAFWRRVESGECPPDREHHKHVKAGGGEVAWSLDTEEGQAIALLTKRADMLAAQIKAHESELDDVRGQIKSAIGTRERATVGDLGGWTYTSQSKTSYREAGPGEVATHVAVTTSTRALRRSKART